MLLFYLKSTIRLITRNKILSAIKVFGLAIGLMTFLLTAMFGLHEIRFDQQHPHAEHLYRYVHRISTPEGLQSFAVTSATVGPALKERFPEVESFCRVLKTTATVRNPANNISFNETRFGFADASFLALFNFPLREDPARNPVLTEPYSVIISPSMARKYFGFENPIGKSLVVDGQMNCIVNGVWRTDMEYSHFDFDFVASFSTLEAIKSIKPLADQLPASRFLEEKGFNNFQTYVLLARDADAEGLQSKFPEWIEDFRGKGKSTRLKPILQTVTSIHLESNLLNELGQNGSSRSVWIWLTLGALILLIACVNYVNISTAEFLIRAKGIGLKKILGVSRASLLASHLVETITLSLASIVLGVVMACLLLPYVNQLLDRKMEMYYSELGLILGAIFIFTVLVAGLYPAYSISKAGTIDAFRDTAIPGKFFSLRNALVFFQILVSFCLVTGSSMIQTQLSFLMEKDLGFKAEQIAVINTNSMMPALRNSYKSSLLGAREILAVGGCSTPPGGSFGSLGITLPEQSGDDERRTMVYQTYVDEDYAKAMGISMEAGRFFDVSSPADSFQYLVLNQTASRIIMGGSANPLNTLISLPGMKIKKEIIGVVNDYHFASLHSEIEPILMEFNPNRISFLLVRFESGSAGAGIPFLEKKWKEIAPDLPFDYYFLDDGFARLYRDEQNQKIMVGYFSMLAILIASVGIFGTTLFSVQQRTREIGIRKILGSEESAVFALLFKPIFFLVSLSCIIGTPLAYWAGTEWLRQYAYRTGFSPVMFFFAFAIILAAVLVSIGYHFLKVSRLNPVLVLHQN